MTMFDNKSSKEIIAKYKERLIKDPENTRLHIKLGDFFLRENNHREAIKSYRQALNIFIREDYPEKALAITRLILKVEPGLTDIKELQKDIYRKMGFNKAARGSEPPAVGRITSQLKRVAEEQEAADQGGVAAKPHTVLVVDDEEHILSSLKRLLRGEPYNVEVAAGAEEGLKILNERKVDIVLSDYSMPGMNGIEFFRQVRVLHPQIVRIMLTAKAGAHDVFQGIKDGDVYRLLTKPWNNDELKEALRLAIIHEDVKEELFYERDFSRKVMDTAQAIILILNTQGRIQSFNPYMEEISGYKLKEVKGKDWMEIFTPLCEAADPQALFLADVSYLQTRGDLCSILTKEGERRAIVWNNKALKDTTGNIIGLLAIGHDVTEEREVEKILRERDEQYRLTFEHVSDIISTLDNSFHILSVTPSLEARLGYRPEEVIGRHFSQLSLIRPATLKKAMKDVQDFSAGKPMEEREYEFVTKDGEARNFSVNSVMHAPEGKAPLIIAVARDITERKKAEKNLQKYLNFIQRIIDAIPAPIFYKDRNMRYISCNKAFENYVGKPKEAIRGKIAHELFPPELADKYKEMDKALFHKQGTQIYESQVKYADGSLHDVIFHKAPFYDALGKVAGLVGTILDITERKKVEEACRLSEAKYHRLVEQMSEGILAIDLEARITFVNPRMAAMLDYQEDELTGKSYYSLVDEAAAVILHKKVERRKAGLSEQYEIKLNRKNGGEVYVLVAASPLKDQSGAVIGSFAVVSDISERKRMEAALRESEERFRSIGSAALDAIIVMDQNGVITLGNAAAEKMFGYSMEEMQGKDLHRLLAPSRYEADYRNGLERFSKTGTGTVLGKILELSALKKDGMEFPVELSVAALRLQGEWQAVGIIRDISARKEAEKERESLIAELHDLSVKDDLTGLYNRRGFITFADMQLKIAKRTGHEFIIIFADLDGLKQINDTFGHNIGSHALVEATALLKETFRESDVIARWGGDEFVILAMEVSREGETTLEERLEENLRAINAQPDRKYTLSISIGIARFDPEQHVSLDELINQADAKMYQVKLKKKEARAAGQTQVEPS